ncbi:hypothetical protein V8B97DRAFT_2022637 [Scleroderma yunnanense]
MWLACKGNSSEILCCGTGLGYILLWKQCSTMMITEFEETLARHHHLHMELQTTVPWAMYPQGVDILVFRMFDGEIHTLCRKDRVVLATKTSGRMIRSAAVDPACTCFVIDNAINRFSLHRMVDSICIRTYNTNPKKTYPKQVTLAEGGTVVIGRSDDGFIYVFNKATSELVQMLQHSFIGQVQTVTVR